MSTLKTNKIQHLTSGFNNVVQFVDGAGTQNGTLCRAWGAFNTTGTLTIRASFNVSSISDNGSDFTINFTNAMSDANYSIVAGQSYLLNAGYVQGMQTPYGVYSTTQFGMQPYSANSAYADTTYIQFAVFR